MSEIIADFIEQIKDSFATGILVKVTLAKPRSKSVELRNIYIRPIAIKKQTVLSFTYRYPSKDEVKNYDLNEAIEKISELLGSHFMKIHLFTIEEDFELSINKKGNGFVRSSPPHFTKAEMHQHDHQKKSWVNAGALYLHRLDIVDEKGKVRPSKNDKFRQINKYIEITDSLIDQIKGKENLSIVDMGAGKGYLTFALYDYLKNSKKRKVEVLGVEMRKGIG